MLTPAPPPVPSLSKDGRGGRIAVARQAHHGVGGEAGWAAVLARRMLACVLLAGVLLVVPCFNGAAEASWLAKVMGAAEQAAPRGARLGSGSLENAAQHLRSLPAKPPGGAALAAQATQEGHWRFVNKAGETFTAGTPEELTRVAGVLLPEAKADAKLALYLTEDTVFQFRAALKERPNYQPLWRELQNVLAALAVRTPKCGVVPASALPPAFADQGPADSWSLDRARRTFELRFVRAALVRSGGHRGRTAAELGVTRQGLTKLMTRLGIKN